MKCALPRCSQHQGRTASTKLLTPVWGKIIMTNNHDERLVRSLVFSALDNLNQVQRAKVLVEILWDTQTDWNKGQEDWDKVGLLLECYEERRDRYLKRLSDDLEELRRVIGKKID